MRRQAKSTTTLEPGGHVPKPQSNFRRQPNSQSGRREISAPMDLDPLVQEELEETTAILDVLSEVEKMYAFLQGLHPKTKQAMLQKNPTDLARLVELTLIHEQALHTVTSNVTRVVRQASTDDLARQLEQLRINVVKLQQQEQLNLVGSQKMNSMLLHLKNLKKRRKTLM